jgi:hypothetical protein
VNAKRLVNSSPANTYLPRPAISSDDDWLGCLRAGWLGAVCGSDSGNSAAGVKSVMGLASPMPSAMLEQEAQIFGFRDSALPPFGIGSQQHMQIVSFKVANILQSISLIQVKLIHKKSLLIKIYSTRGTAQPHLVFITTTPVCGAGRCGR